MNFFIKFKLVVLPAELQPLTLIYKIKDIYNNFSHNLFDNPSSDMIKIGCSLTNKCFQQIIFQSFFLSLYGWLFLYSFIFLCLFVCMIDCLFISLFFYFFIYLIIYLFIYSFYLFIYFFLSFFLSLFVLLLQYSSSLSCI